ncbi:MAG TPA: hypothetical protein VK926_05725 [Gaiellaceae bacterium]|nr:hypothetical protein [Gaiellaceae bacterium]
MERIKALSVGTKLALVAGTALFLNLSLTWQKIQVDFGPAGRAERLLDGWDVWGLLIGLLALALVVLTALAHLTEVELPPGIPWEGVALAIGVLVFGLTLLKNLTDAGSTLASYAGIALAALVLAGVYLDPRKTRSTKSSSAVRVQ